MKRALALYLPYLSSERPGGLPIDDCQLPIEETHLANRQSAIGNRQLPAVTIVPCGQTVRIVHVNRAAEAMRLRRGQTLAEARAIAPGVLTREDDPLVDRRELESLAVWAQCLSPTVHIEGGDTLIVDVTGCKRLWSRAATKRRSDEATETERGESNLLRYALEGIRGRSFTVRGAIADTAGAAWALAHAGEDEACISEQGANAVDLLPLPVWSLRIDEKTVESLRLVGVETVGALLHLPRSSLASRFGEQVLERIDQALGDLPEVLTPYVPQPAVSARLEWGTPIGQRDLLEEAVRRAVKQFCEELARRVAGVRQIMVTFYCPGISSSAGTVT